MKNLYLKICRIKDIHTARFLARCRVDFLCLHAIFGIPNKEQLEQFQRIISEIRAYYPQTKTVLVTRIDDTDELIKVYKILPTDFVQISSTMYLSNKQKFLTLASKINQEVQIFDVLSAKESNFNQLSDSIISKFIVIDKEFAGGTGEQIQKSQAKEIISKLEGEIVLLAGGMGRVDINSWIEGLNINGVDIMSSMEIGNGNTMKDIKKIIDYIKKYRKTEVITKLPYSKKEIKIVKFNNDNLQKFDYSSDFDIIQVEYKNFSDLLTCIMQIHEKNQFIPISIQVATNKVEEAETLLQSFQKDGFNIESIEINVNEIHS